YYKFRLQDGSDCDWYVDNYAHDSYDHEDRYENGTGMMVEGANGNPCSDSAAEYVNNSFDITVYDSSFTTPAWAQNAVIYQIMPDRFRNGDPSNDSAWPYGDVYGTAIHLHPTWNEPPDDPRDSGSPYYEHWSADFFGGDLQGIMDELDYLQSLGVTAIYLNPIFSSPSNHGYDTSDYLKISPRYGDNALFAALADEAESRGIKIILDGVFNHTGSDSIYFDRYSHWDAGGNPGTSADGSGACEHQTSIYDTFYTFNAGSGPCSGRTDGYQQYDSWWGYDTLPLLNENTAIKDFIFDYSNDDASPAAVIQYWYAQGADGWRFDVADEISHTFWQDFRTQVKGNDSLNGPLYSEVWYEARPWLYGDQLDATMNYRYRKAVLGFLIDSDWTDNDNQADRTIWALTPAEFDYVLNSIREDYPAPAWYAMMNLMDSHDTNRALFVLRERSTDLNAAIRKMQMIAALQFTFPGAPTIYYGDEVGLGAVDWGGYGLWGAGKDDGSDIQDDPYNRHTYPWENESGALPASGGINLPVTDLRAVYRVLGHTRGNYDVLRTGDVTTLLTDNASRIYAYARTDGSGTQSPTCALAIFNRDTASHSVTLDLSAVSGVCPNGLTLYDVLNNGASCYHQCFIAYSEQYSRPGFGGAGARF
ncbi:MAG TPA: glycoside hydrolase family 13 protein, partial [Anaerolineales bacterium]|nr:glycoside hydrolase family 13 protein [Anaerolineales bacterium]